MPISSLWPNGWGVGLLIQRLWISVLPGVYLLRSAAGWPKICRLEPEICSFGLKICEFEPEICSLGLKICSMLLVCCCWQRPVSTVCFDDGAGCELASLTTCNVAEACCCCLRPAVAVVPEILGLSWRSVVLLPEVLLKICCFLLRSAANACSCVVYWSAAMRLKINSWICCSLAEDWTWALTWVFHPVFMDRMVVFCKQMRFMENAYSSDMIQQNMQVVSLTSSAWLYVFGVLLLWDKWKNLTILKLTLWFWGFYAKIL